LSKLEEVCCCDVPDILKVRVVSLIEDHCKSCFSPIPIDLASLGDLPDDFKTLFMKLMAHVFGLKSKSRDLVLKVLKLFADYDNSSYHPAASPVIPPSAERDIGVHETHVFQVFINFLFTIL
jgi:hypothetical protein